MAKLSNTTTALKPGQQKKKGGKSPIKNKKKAITNVGGGEGSALKEKSELYLTAVSTFAGEDTFYESGQSRIDRVVDLTHKLTKKDPEWIERFVPYLRGPEVNIRTISLIIAAEYVAAGGPNGRKVIDSVCQRADEPAEILAYWMQKHYGWDRTTYPLPSPKLPQALRKGLSDACNRLYNEYTLLKYDGNSRGVSMAQVLNLIHPTPSDEKQSSIFGFIIDKAYGNDPDMDKLPMVKANLALREVDPEDFRKGYPSSSLKEAGVTWEQLGGLLHGPWTAKAWESVIPTMGYMALLRNLRNFEGAGISEQMQDYVIERLTDPDAVAKSRQLPFRFLSAYNNLNSDTYSRALGKALDLSVKNIPTFDGKTLVLVDKSGSMSTPLSTNSSVSLWEVGALFGVALALKGEDVDLAVFGDRSRILELPKGSSVLKGVRHLEPNHGVGHGTNIWGSVKKEYADHQRVVIFTDMQDNWNDHYGYSWSKHDGYTEDKFGHIPFIHYFDIGGYGQGAPLSLTGANRFQYGGFSDSTFKLMALLERGDADWPF